MSPDPQPHHLNLGDLERATGGKVDLDIPLACHEDDCFIDGSELDSHRPPPASLPPGANPRNQQSNP